MTILLEGAGTLVKLAAAGCSDAEYRKGRVANQAMGEIPQSAESAASKFSSDDKDVRGGLERRVKQSLFHRYRRSSEWLPSCLLRSGVQSDCVKECWKRSRLNPPGLSENASCGLRAAARVFCLAPGCPRCRELQCHSHREST